MHPIFYFTMTSMVLAELLICLYLFRPAWLSRSRGWRLACLYGVYLCSCSMLFVSAAVTAGIRPDQHPQQVQPIPQLPQEPPHTPAVQWT